MDMKTWKNMLDGNMSGLKKEKKILQIPKENIYRVKWKNGQITNLINHDEAIRRINEFMNRTGWEWVRVYNTENKQQQIVYEPTSTASRGFLHLKKLNDKLLIKENITDDYLKSIKKNKPLAKKKLEKMGFKVTEIPSSKKDDISGTKFQISGGDLKDLYTSYISTDSHGGKDYITASQFEKIANLKEGKIQEGYKGWANRETWNVSLWINNDEHLYRKAVTFMKRYKGTNPYKVFINHNGLTKKETPDGVKWFSSKLEYDELNEMMREME